MSDTKLIAGKTFLVTGATSGIGAVTAEELAGSGAKVVLVGRNAKKTLKMVRRLRQKSRNESVDYILADLSSLQEIRSLVAEFNRRYPRLDVLVNNVGGIYLKRHETAEGLEMSFALNYLGCFLLTTLLLNKLQDSAPARIINVASSSHLRGKINFDDLQGRGCYRGPEAYAQSKLSLVLFTYELARRLADTGVTVNALHPGLVATSFGRNHGWARFISRRLRQKHISPKEGARTILHLATSSCVENITGKYFIDNRTARSSDLSYDENLASRLWQVSEYLSEKVT